MGLPRPSLPEAFYDQDLSSSARTIEQVATKHSEADVPDLHECTGVLPFRTPCPLQQPLPVKIDDEGWAIEINHDG